MTAATKHIEIEAYASFELDIVCKDSQGNPVDVTGCSAASQIRRTPECPDVLAAFTVLVSQDASGLLRLQLPASESAKLQDVLEASWDLLLTDSAGRPMRLASGKVHVLPAVTRP